MAEAVAPHQRHAVFQIFIHADGERIVGHHLRHTGAARITAFRHHALHQVALGKDSYQFAIVQHRHGADVVLHHDAYGFEHGLAQFRLERVLVFDQVADTHWIPPGKTDNLSKKHYRARREYMLGRRCKEREKGWEGDNFPPKSGYLPRRNHQPTDFTTGSDR